MKRTFSSQIRNYFFFWKFSLFSAFNVFCGNNYLSRSMISFLSNYHAKSHDVTWWFNSPSPPKNFPFSGRVTFFHSSITKIRIHILQTRFCEKNIFLIQKIFWAYHNIRHLYNILPKIFYNKYALKQQFQGIFRPPIIFSETDTKIWHLTVP